MGLRNVHQLNAITKRFDLGKAGLSCVVKDCIDVEGHVSACGSAALLHQPVAVEHSDVVQTVLDAHCQIIGKANMHELAFGMSGINTTFGTTVNPLWPDLISGGSSSGSAAAVAAQLCDFAIGTDTGGSVRQPAICCGIYGIKPTFSRISRRGCHPAKSSLDSVGVCARSANMLSAAMSAIDPTFTSQTWMKASPPRLAWLQAPLADKAVKSATKKAARILPLYHQIAFDLLDTAFDASIHIMGAEMAQAFGHLLQEPALLGRDVADRLIKAQSITHEMVKDAETVRTAFTTQIDIWLKDVDALIMPALPHLTFTIDEADRGADVLELSRFLRPFNLSGHPAIALPLKLADHDAPMGLQIVGSKNNDAQLCAIACWLADTFPIFRDEDA